MNMSLISPLRHSLRAAWRKAGQFDFTWRYALNARAALSFAMQRQPVSGEAALVLASLNRDGIAITTAERLLGMPSSYTALVAAVDQLEKDLDGDLQAARMNSDRRVQKPYMFWLLGENAKIDRDSVYAQFALQPTMTQIVNEYLGMYSNLCNYNVWHNFATHTKPMQSQLWHRDPEDRYIVKVFICLSDVDDGAGPFTYAPGTHRKGAVRGAAPFLYMDGATTRSDDTQMETIVPRERWIKGTGSAGTIIFADTHGYHKGGLCRFHDRIMYTAEFLSPSAASGISTIGVGR